MFNKLFKKSFTTLSKFSKSRPHQNGYHLQSFFNGKWQESKNYEEFLNPLHGNSGFMKVPVLQADQFPPIIEEMKKVQSSGLHNPLKNTDRYLLYGDVCRKVSEALHNDEIFKHFVELINTVFPKSQGQSVGEMKIVRNFFDNFAGDNVRYLARGFHVPGDHTGQTTTGYRWPYGPVSIITPFNFPLEIPLLQIMGALFMGNKAIAKVDSKVALPLEEFVRLMHYCGLPKDDLLLIHTTGQHFEDLILQCDLKMTLFTGSKKVSDRLTQKLEGRIKVEDAGLDWKILGPDVKEVDYVAHMIDHDAYALSGQKCSAQSLLFVHENWTKSELYSKVKSLTSKRTLKDLTNCPILSWNNKRIQDHVDSVLSIPGTELLWGGKPIQEKHKIPDCYGSYEPTAIKVPLEHLFDTKYYSTLTTELFGPFQLIFEYKASELSKVLEFFGKLDQKLTAGVVSSDHEFLNEVLGNSSNGTTYAGIRARTTGAPQNHWFGPGGDPKSGGIGSIEAIQVVWSHHREIVYDTVMPKSKYILVQS